MPFRWLTMVFGIPQRVRLPFGSQWIARNDACGRMILRGHFERAESQFVESLLKPGMTVLDIGAHHGYYSLLASQKVGPNGRVFAFEPSPRERARLIEHLRINGCTNTRVEPFAMGERAGPSELYVVQGKETGFNSLRPPEVSEATTNTQVHVIRLGEYLEQNQIAHVDFIKLDVEGGELGVLKGAGQLLERRPRPVILCEVDDARTRPWGYAAREVLEYLEELEFQWFLPQQAGRLEALTVNRTAVAGNFVAVPKEKQEAVLGGY